MKKWRLECGSCGEPLETKYDEPDDVHMILPCRRCGRKIRAVRSIGTMPGRKPTVRTTNDRDPKYMCRSGRKKVKHD